MDRLTALFAATTVALGATSAWFAQQLLSEREHSASLAARVAAFRSALDRANGNSMPAPDPAPAGDLDPSSTPAESNESRTALQGNDAEARITRFRVNEAQLLRNPQYREAWLTMMALHLRRTYTDLQRLPGLSDSEYETFLATMAQFELEQTLRSFEAPLQSGLDLAARIAAARRLSIDTEAARRQALRDALGEAQYRQWVDHQRTAEGRRELERWRVELAAAGLSLTPDTAQELLPILVEYRRRMATVPEPAVVPGRTHPKSDGSSSALLEAERGITSQADINAWLGDALTGIVTTEQREMITATVDRDVQLRRAELELDRLRLSAGEGR